MIPDRYEIILAHKPLRFLRRWSVEVNHVIHTGSYRTRESVGSMRFAFTKSGALLRGAIVADEDRRIRRDRANAEVVRLP